jgi:hypothetical protein
MVWKRLVRWFRSTVTVDVDVDEESGKLQVAVSIRLGRATALTDTFEWEVGWSPRLSGATAKRRLVLRSLE